MTAFLEYLVSGLLSGSVYGLIAIGIVIIYKASSVFNFAHGELTAIGCFLVWSLLVKLNLHFVLIIILVLATAVFIGFTIERLVLRPLIGQPILSAIMVTLGLSQVFAALILIIWPGTGRVFPHFLPSGQVNILGVTIAVSDVLTFCLVIATLIVLNFLFKRTRIGLAMRCTAEDHQLAQSDGIKVTMVFALCWVISIVIAAIGGVVVGYNHGVSFWLADVGIKAFPAVIFGGLESISGAFLGGIAVGVLENFGGGYLDSYVGGGVKEIVPFIIMLFALIFRPYGLFGYKRIERI